MFSQIGALSVESNGKEQNEDGQLTFLGRVIAYLPVDLHLGKMIVLGHVFGCLDESLIIGQSVVRLLEWIYCIYTCSRCCLSGQHSGLWVWACNMLHIWTSTALPQLPHTLWKASLRYRPCSNLPATGESHPAWIQTHCYLRCTRTF